MYRRLARVNNYFIAMLYGLLMLVSQQASAEANRLKPFSTDGCSLWVDGTPTKTNLWRDCCVAHDKAYWLGGSQEQRQQADTNFKLCVSEKAGRSMAEYMYVNVLWGGSAYWLTPYRWGYGWNYWEAGKPRGYKIPSPEEQLQIARLIDDAEKTIAQDALMHPVTP